jgi:hypothetical protein
MSTIAVDEELFLNTGSRLLTYHKCDTSNLLNLRESYASV